MLTLIGFSFERQPIEVEARHEIDERQSCTRQQLKFSYCDDDDGIDSLLRDNLRSMFFGVSDDLPQLCFGIFKMPAWKQW